MPRIDLRLLAEEARRVDVALELLDRHREVVLGRAVLREERRRDLVHVHVGRLRGEHHRDEQLEIAAEAERDLRVGVLGGEPLDDRPDALATPPEAAPPRFADVATRHEATRSTRVVASGRRRIDEVRERLLVDGCAACSRIAATAASTSYSVRRNSTSGPRSAQYAPRPTLVRHADASRVHDAQPAREQRGRTACACARTRGRRRRRPEKLDDARRRA